MKKLITFIILATAFLFVGCEDDCGPTTYRKEVGIGYVFMYDTNNNTSYPIEGAKVVVNNLYWEYGLKGTHKGVASETYTTDAEGRYQVRFVEKGCYYGEEIYCNSYDFYYNNEWIFGFSNERIDIYAQDNILELDTIKIYK